MVEGYKHEHDDSYLHHVVNVILLYLFLKSITNKKIITLSGKKG